MSLPRAERNLYRYLTAVSGGSTKVIAGVNNTQARYGKDLHSSYHFPRFFHPNTQRNSLERLQMFQAPNDMPGWTVYDFGCCLGALSFECVRRGAAVKAWECSVAKVIGCTRLADFLNLSRDQIQFYHQDLISWLRDPALAELEFRQNFAPADLTICCSVDGSLPETLRSELYRFLVRCTKEQCWFENDTSEPAAQVAAHLEAAGFRHIKHVGDCEYRHAFIASPHSAPTKQGSFRKRSAAARRNDSPTLSRREQGALRGYIDAFLGHAAHRECFEQNSKELFSALVDRDRLSIPLMPVDKHVSTTGDYETIRNWYFKYVKSYARHHKEFINGLQPVLRRKLFEAKLLRHLREQNIRHFLARLSKCRDGQSLKQNLFFDGFDLDCGLLEQGVRLKEYRDFSSGRGYDEGAIVNRIVLERNGGQMVFFLKGAGKSRKEKLERRGIKRFEFFEVTVFEAAKIVGLNFIECGFYPDASDPMMSGYTLLQEIKGVNSNALFHLLPKHRFAIRPDYAPNQDRLIQQFARVAALGDLLRKEDRIVVQVLHTEYDANYMIDLKLLEQDGKDAVYTIDNNHLFSENNHGILSDIKHGRCAEIGIVSAFETFFTDSHAREEMLALYEGAYLDQWKKMKSKSAALGKLIENIHGRHSREYKVFQHSMQSDPEKEFGEQKAELLRTVCE